MSDGRINLPDGESINVSFTSKDGSPVPTAAEPTTPPPAARAQPVVPPHQMPRPIFPGLPGAPAPGSGGEVTHRMPNAAPQAQHDWSQPLQQVDVTPEQPPTEQLPGPTGTPVPGSLVDMDSLAQATDAQTGHTDWPMGQLIDVGDDGLVVNGERLPEAGLTGPIRVEHIDHDDSRLRVTVSYIAERDKTSVQQDLEKQFLIEDVPHHEAQGGCTCQLQGQQQRVVDLINRTRRIMRRFVLQRDRDDTGLSGTGIVAEGVQLSDGRVIVRWNGTNSSIVIWNDIAQVLAIHGHKGATRLRWLDANSQ